jgi:hypothetical protein
LQATRKQANLEQVLKQIKKNEQANLKRMTEQENKYMQQERKVIYTSLEDIEETDWHWSEHEVREFDELWSDGMPIVEIALVLRRSEISVLFQAFDRLYKGEVKPRNWNIW